MKNAMTIDIEDWYHSQDLDIDIKDWPDYEDRVKYGTNTLLDLLSQHNIRATFFILGFIAEKHPGLVREIASRGHEIGSHGRYHRMVTRLTQEEFREELLFSKGILEDITGKPVTIYRAPTWSITKDTLWALEILEEAGFKCDSSIQPFVTPFSGMKGAPVKPYRPVVNGRELDILEFPPTALQLGRVTVPFSGGFYLRLFPVKCVEWALKRVNSEREGMIYVHPWELDVEQPRLKVSPLVKLSHYYALSKTAKKLDRLLGKFEFVTLGELLKDANYPSVRLEGNSLYSKTGGNYVKV